MTNFKMISVIEFLIGENNLLCFADLQQVLQAIVCKHMLSLTLTCKSCRPVTLLLSSLF